MINTPVWDAATRVFHIVLIVSVSLSLYSAFEDKFGIWGKVHYWSGLVVLGLVTWRVIWGFIGSETNLFLRAARGPKAVFENLKGLVTGGVKPSTGHGAAGGWSVVLMLSLLLVQGGLGLFASDGMFFSGPLSSSRDLLPVRPTSLHETLGLWLMGLIALHILVVLTYQFVRRIDLVRPMIHGKKALEGTSKAPKLRSAWLGLASLAVTAGGLTYWLGGNGP